ncbi:serine/threonine protein kinase [Xenorhabdus bovienii]|uniref:Glycine amidinotransferase, mitochondrial n=2 Tax=Xenorhabdus bovienii TaxID=40576 RepID=A0A0B6XEF0_XENBV|nr:serine/threonine protein kinase [Xenorhabdus bovienii]MCG3470435.1 serine/threonine protein kinase [Xenorhabdus bovienii]CDG97929.1 Glycine amidinotransferase, mitochondrial [Xenorhabdus bovienii str. puntauvense]CDM90649.1 Glycine amidinotransferase, mitochondrial [Xenorhabdus bovienii]
MTNSVHRNEHQKQNNSPTHVECHTEWGKLRHVIVGRADNACIPPPEPAFMARIPENSDMRGRYGPRSQESIDAANEQLDGLASILTSRGIRVDRPTPLDFNSPVQTPDFTQGTMFGCQPPRDVLITVGREILEATMSFRSRFFEYLCYRPLISTYLKEDGGMRHESAPRPRLSDASYRHGYLSEAISMKTRKEWVKKKEFVTTEEEPIFEAADIFRCGKDLFVQHGFTTNMKGVDWLKRHFSDYRIHPINFPGDPFPSHIDCTLLPLRPGLILSNPVRPLLPEFKQFFIHNDWQIIEAASPAHSQSPPLCYSSVWLSMNLLSLDEKTVCVEETEIHQMEQLDKLGFEIIPIPFRNAYPFGGGLHCATTDIWREGNLEDYFPAESYLC